MRHHLKDKFKDYLPEFLGVMLCVFSLNLWYFSSLAIHNEAAPVFYDFIINGLIILIGAFFGSYSAFKLNDKKSIQENYLAEKAAINKGLFITCLMMNAIKSVCKSYGPYESSPSRPFNLPAIKPSNYDHLRFDFESLCFLLEDSPQLLMDLDVEQKRFEMVFSAILLRNNFYVNEVQPVLSDSGLSNGDVTKEALKKTLGDRLFYGLENYTNEIYFHLKLTDKSLNEMYEEIIAEAKKRFPNEKFIKWQSIT